MEINGNMQQDKWKAPCEGLYKLNTDTALLLGNQVGMGGVVRDHEWEVVVALCCREQGGVDVAIVEALSAPKGLQIAMQAGFTKLMVEVDCKQLFTHLNEGRSDVSPFGKIVQDIQVLALQCQQVVYCHVRRNSNKVAHNLAQLSKSFDSLRVWLEDVSLRWFVL